MGFRTDFRAGCKDVLDTYSAANPTLLPHVYDYPPESFNTPCAYVEKAVTETYRHTSGLRQRVARVNVVIVNKLVSNDQATDEQDVLLDGLIDAFTADPHAAGATTLLEPVGATDTELEASGTRYAGAVLTIEGSIQEGRA